MISIYFNQNSLESFLYLISSIFIPMAAIQITDYYIIKKNVESTSINKCNFIIFIIAFTLYRIMLKIDFFLSISIVVMIITSIIVILANKLLKKEKQNDKKLYYK